jgi:hypothetical protein
VSLAFSPSQGFGAFLENSSPIRVTLSL